jgi:hypothetical protein
MRNDMNDLEHHALFVAPIKRFKYEVEELNKMLDARLDLLTKHVCDNELSATAYKNTKADAFRAIDAANTLCHMVYQELNKQLDKAFSKLEETEEEKKEKLTRGA